MKKFEDFGRSLSKADQQKIKGGFYEEPPGGGDCPVQRTCYTYAFPLAGICYPSGTECWCKETQGSLAGRSLDCTNIA